ncbi:alanine racemase [Limisalsivibrio acetivorans]|uniref:alanine racemase n=1 Tax=Limisalsivibrio acetivorans TaxID=1304888 RepID=UPI0003B4BBA1|nr:alanine racemase [Limisalsivibrio acetivorans]
MTQKKIEALRPTYAQIDLRAFAHNIEKAREIAGTDIIAVVKADGYGHGALRMAEYAFKECGVNRFGVATILEGMILREHLGEKPMIFVLGYVDSNFYDEVTEFNLILTMFDKEIADSYHSWLEENNLKADVSLKIDTGMNRLGFEPDLTMYDFTTAWPRLRVCHVMTHLSSSDTDREYTRHQIQLFDSFVEKNRIRVHTSVMNSAGLAGYENTHSLVRPGLFLYGYLYGENRIDLHKVMKIYSKVVHIKTLRKGETTSYNRTFTAERDMTIGVVPVGYADGYRRCFSNNMEMLVNGVYCPVVGTVCMDMTMIDLRGVDLNGAYPQVEVLGENISANYWAEKADTISYEILCGISDRIPRIYSD